MQPARNTRILRQFLAKRAGEVLAREIENNFSTPRAGRAEKKFSATRRRKLNVSRRSRAFSLGDRQAFPPRGKNPFDITASEYKIGGSADRLCCFSRIWRGASAVGRRGLRSQNNRGAVNATQASRLAWLGGAKAKRRPGLLAGLFFSSR